MPKAPPAPATPEPSPEPPPSPVSPAAPENTPDTDADARPPRRRLTASEQAERMARFGERKEAFIRAVRKG